MPVTAELHTLPFLAVVPRGHEVVVATLRRSADSDVLASLVHDRTAGIVYCGEALWGPLDRSELALTDPIAALTRFSWVVDRVVAGRAASAMISTTSAGDANHAHTRLYVELESAQPYR